MKLRLIPLVEIDDTSVNEFVEGKVHGIYGRTKAHPAGRRSQVFPHPDLESEETIQKWLKEWPRARFDIFALQRMWASIGVDFVMQEERDGKWVTLPQAAVHEFGDVTSAPAPVVKRGRGRPRKNPKA